MKCIKVGKEIKKIDDNKAIDLVYSGKAKFVAKHIFKEAHGKGVAETPTKIGSKSQLKKNSKKVKEIMKK